ncbi:MAG: PD-(D/E)XK nuclease family protein [Chthoniobacterales bacterium]
MQLELELQARRGPSLLLASSPEAAWQGGIADWLSSVAQNSWRTPRPAVIVVPTRGQALALKLRFVSAEKSALGLQFLTPPYLRALLWSGLEAPLPQPEHLRLLLAIAAEEQLEDTSITEAARLAAISVRRTPAHLLRLLDQLEAAGCEFEQIDLPAFRPVVGRFRQHLARAGFRTCAETDRTLLAGASQDAPLFSHLLATGFHGAHWPLWHLLRAGVQASEQSTIVLQNPRADAAELDAAWIGSWEESCNEGRQLPAVDDEPSRDRETIFLTGIDTREQAEAIAAAALKFLAEPDCTQLGIVFAAPGALCRRVASLLTQKAIPHYDAMGQLAPGPFEAPDFWAWMELQRTPRLQVLLRFLTTLPSAHPIFAAISRAEIHDSLHRALGEIALDDLTVLTSACRDQGARGERLAEALQAIEFLPACGSFEELLAATGKAFARLDWTSRWLEIAQQASWAAKLGRAFSRTLYLKWLSEIGVTFRIARDTLGAHPYARVQLLTPAHAEDQSWSHLILAGLNEGSWPGRPGGDFLPAVQIDALNQSVQRINRTATRMGEQGEGHVAVRAGKTLFLGAAQQRQLALAQFAGLIESARHGLALTASVVQEATPERVSNPSEFLSRLYHAAHGQALAQATMRELREETRRWLDAAALFAPPAPAENRAISRTRLAYTARRAIQPSGEHDFALRTPPDQIAPLSVSEVEAMLKSPALVWLRRYLGVEGDENSTYAWNATVGKWTHAWLAAAIGKSATFTSFPSGAKIAAGIISAAETKRAEVQRLAREADRAIPDWWESGWENALCLALTLGRILRTAEGWRWAVAEWRLEEQPIAVGEGQNLLLRGRADLLLANTIAQPSSLDVPALWMIDFKTGSKKAIGLKSAKTAEQLQQRVLRQVLKREALQLALYALAAHQLGAQKVEVSLLSPLLAKAEPQLALDDFALCAPAFRELARMQATGIFGMHGSIRGAYTFAKDYPLATLAVDPEIAEERWEKTHPDLPIDQEGW